MMLSRKVLKYAVITPEGTNLISEITEDRKAVKPGYSSSPSVNGKWQLLTYNEKDDRYTFCDREEPDRPFFLARELIAFLDEVAVEDLLIGSEE